MPGCRQGERFGQLLVHRHGRGTRAGPQHGRALRDAQESRTGQRRRFVLVVVVVVVVVVY